MVLSPQKQAQAFGRRLTQEMLAQGYRAKRSPIKADAVILQQKAGVKSLEMARRYIKGTSMPKSPRIIRNICTWLDLREAYLLRGELPKRPSEEQAQVIVDSRLLTECLARVFTVAKQHDLNISQETVSKITAYLYLGYVHGDTPPSDMALQEMIKVFNDTE